MKKLLLKLVKSIRYYYLSKKPVTETARIIWIIVTETKEFVKESILYIIFANFKKEEKKDKIPISIFGSFIRKLSKEKGYVLVKSLKEVKNPDQTFKVFKGKVFNKDIHILTNISDILNSLSRKESPKLECVNWVTKDYNLYSRSKLPEVTRILISKTRHRKKKLIVLLEILSGSLLA